ncbi:MAG: hypothetical protein JJT85_11570 [Chromatiales bacterium]|nr:hypothetical protein [Chromatiales bacterium]
MSLGTPVIIYVPGLRPKPPPEVHRALLHRCLIEGIHRTEPALARALAGRDDWLRLVAWGDLLYPEYRDPSIDQPAIEQLLSHERAVPADIAIVRSLRWRVRTLLHKAGNHWSGLARLLADGRAQLHLRDSGRYFDNEDGLADRIRGRLDSALDAAEGRHILLLAHSFGTVIAWDTLWLRGHRQRRPAEIDFFVTMGSPLGSRLVRRRLAGAREKGRRRYPPGIRRWQNLAALGGLTALGRRFADDFAGMRRMEMVEEIRDRTDLVNPFYGVDGLNVHRCYGYFVNPVTGRVIADWWLASTAAPPAGPA